ncbi:MAG: PA2779 family protein [Chromatiales bacterium]|jgi:hypothetical protein|nr:PA2779 family protein [Chromatiales bacterium]
MHLQRSLAAVTLAAFLTAGIQAPAAAAAIATRDAVAPSATAGGERADQLARVRAALDRDDVRAALVARGVDPGAAAGRVAALSDQQLADLATQLDELPAGGSALAVVGIVFLVLLILEVTGVIDIFKKI